MVEQDTIRLLRECDAGIKMGVSSIDDVFEYVQSEDFKKALKFCTNAKMAMDGSDQTIADLMTDGCNMGVKSLSRFLNQYEAADEKSKDITKRLIGLEEKLVVDARRFL